jgi:hypothetical protein
MVKRYVADVPKFMPDFLDCLTCSPEVSHQADKIFALSCAFQFSEYL